MNRSFDIKTVSRTPPPLFLALWSLRHLLVKEPLETLDLIQEWGVTTVEVAVYLKWNAIKFQDELNKRGLSTCGLAAPPLNLDREVSYYVGWAKQFLSIFKTNTLLLQSPTPLQFTENRQEHIEISEKLASLIVNITEALGKEIEVSYHCYPHDFVQVNGSSFISRLFSREKCPPNLGLQLDTYWLGFSDTSTDTYKSLPVHSIHLNERDREGKCCVLGTQEPSCFKYLRPLLGRNLPIKYILENDPTDEQAKADDQLITNVFEKCFKDWPTIWQKLTTGIYATNGERLK
jgi:sugar phosphate isomerase/epimerase